MLIKIGNFEYTEVWNQVFYKKLSNYPKITDWEIKNILDFVSYEKKNGRKCDIECENTEIVEKIHEALENPMQYINVQRPKLITECTACPYRKGCETEFVCHTTSIENAIKIFECGYLYSAVKARGIEAEKLMLEKRNAANDPTDFFEYVMFSWGNCQAGDRLVMERKLNRMPSKDDLSKGFTPGIRFYFKYDQIIKHPNAVIDGFLPVKIKDEIELCNWVHTIIIPNAYKEKVKDIIDERLKGKIIYVENNCKDIWEWSEKVYKIVEDNLHISEDFGVGDL